MIDFGRPLQRPITILVPVSRHRSCPRAILIPVQRRKSYPRSILVPVPRHKSGTILVPVPRHKSCPGANLVPVQCHKSHPRTIQVPVHATNPGRSQLLLSALCNAPATLPGGATGLCNVPATLLVVATLFPGLCSSCTIEEYCTGSLPLYDREINRGILHRKIATVRSRNTAQETCHYNRGILHRKVATVRSKSTAQEDCHCTIEEYCTGSLPLYDRGINR